MSIWQDSLNLEGFDPSSFAIENIATWPPDVSAPYDFNRTDEVVAVVIYNNGRGTIILQPARVFKHNGKVFSLPCGKFDFLLNIASLTAELIQTLTPGTLVWVWVEDLNPDGPGYYDNKGRYFDYFDFAPKSTWTTQRVRLSRAMVELLRRQRADALWPKLQVGQVYQAVVTNIDPLTFVRIEDCLDGIIPLPELQHGWVFDPAEVVSPGETFQVQVISVNPERRRVTFSRKALLPDPWKVDSAQINNLVGQTKIGVMVNQSQTGAIWVEVEPGIAGPLYPSNEPDLEYEKDKAVLVKVLGVNFDRQRLILSCQEALREMFGIDLDVLVGDDPLNLDSPVSEPSFSEVDLDAIVDNPEEIDLDAPVGVNGDESETEFDLDVVVRWIFSKN